MAQASDAAAAARGTAVNTDINIWAVNIGAINIGPGERVLSIFGGSLLATLAVLRTGAGVGGTVLALASGVLVARGITGYCPLYQLPLYQLMERWASAGDDRDDEGGDDPRSRPFSRHPGDIFSDAGDKDPVDETSQESFPASDPPSFAPGVGTPK
jgi:hypothetical protein